MKRQQIQLIRNSWILISKDQIGFGLLFYNRLFEVAPELKGLFKNDIDNQSIKITSTLLSIIKILDGGYSLENDIKRLAERHSQYGVKPEYFEVFGSTLQWTIKNYLKENWNESIGKSWEYLFIELSSSMQKLHD